MDQAILPVCISPFPIIYWLWSLMEELRWSFLYSYEGTISQPLWGMMVPNKHIWPGSATAPTQTLCTWRLALSGALLASIPGRAARWVLLSGHSKWRPGRLPGPQGALPLQRKMQLSHEMCVRLIICPFQIFVLVTLSLLDYNHS